MRQRFEPHLPAHRAELIAPLSLEDHRILIAAGDPGPTARLLQALEVAGAEVALCTDPDDAVASVREAYGLWDLGIVTGAPRGVPASTVADRLRDADAGLPVAICVPHAGANGDPTIGHRDPAERIVRVAYEIMHVPPAHR